MPFVAAVSLNDKGHPMHLKLSLVSGFTSKAIGKWAKANLAPGTLVTSDGLACFAAVPRPDACTADVVGDASRGICRVQVGQHRAGQPQDHLAGAYHSLKYRKYAAHYLAAFAYRFNRRFDLRDLVARLIVDVARSKPVKETVVRAHAEAP